MSPYTTQTFSRADDATVSASNIIIYNVRNEVHMAFHRRLSSKHRRVCCLVSACLLLIVTRADYGPSSSTNAISWGLNTWGQLGRGLTSPVGGPGTVTVPLNFFVPTLDASVTYPPNFEMVSVGWAHAVATSDSGQHLWVWGHGGVETGLYEFDGNFTAANLTQERFAWRSQPILVPTIPGFTYPVTAIAASTNQTWLLDALGFLFVAGDELTDGTFAGYFHRYPETSPILHTSGIACATSCVAWNQTGFWNGTAEWESTQNIAGFLDLKYVAISDSNIVISDGVAILARGINQYQQIASSTAPSYATWTSITQGLALSTQLGFSKIVACETMIMALNVTTIYARGLVSAEIWDGNAATDASAFTTLPIPNVIDIGCVGTANLAVYEDDGGTRLVTWSGSNVNLELGRPYHSNLTINSTVAYNVRAANMSTESTVGIALNVGSGRQGIVPIAMAWGAANQGQLGTGDVQLGSLASPTAAFTPDVWASEANCSFLGGSQITILQCASSAAFVGDWNGTASLGFDGSPIYPRRVPLSAVVNCSNPIYAAAYQVTIAVCPDSGILFTNSSASDPIATSYYSFSGIVSAQCGYWHCSVCSQATCALWGDNTYGQVTFPTSASGSFSFPSRMLALGGVLTLTAERNLFYLYGFGTSVVLSPFFNGNITQIAAGYAHALLVTTAGLYGVGANDYGQLGTSPSSTISQGALFVPTGIPKLVMAAAVWNTSFVLDSFGGVFSFGAANLYAMHGFATASTTPWIPRQVDLGSLMATSLCTQCRGQSMFAFVYRNVPPPFKLPTQAPTALGTRFRLAFGPNFYGQSGVGTVGENFPRAVASNVSGTALPSASPIATYATIRTTFAISTNGSLLSWSGPLQSYAGGAIYGYWSEGLETLQPTVGSGSSVVSLGGYLTAAMVLADHTSYNYTGDYFTAGTWEALADVPLSKVRRSCSWISSFRAPISEICVY